MTKYKLNTINFGIEVECASWMEKEMLRRARLVEAAAVALAPVGRNESTRAGKGTSYKQSFGVRSGVRTVPPFKTRRAYGQVYNTKSYAMHLEYGVRRKVKDDKGKDVLDDDGNATYERQPGKRVLGRALDAARG